MKRHQNSVTYTVLALFSFFLLIGCGGESGPVRYHVTGTVTLDGEPLGQGTIFFVPQGDGMAGGSTEISNGAYEFRDDKGIAEGAYRVEILSKKKTGQKIDGPGPDGKVDEFVSIIPEKYNTASELTATIKAGDNQLDFDLKSK